MISLLLPFILAGPTHFAIVGDYGKNTVAEADVATMIAGWNPDFVVTTGDNNYETGSASTIDANVGQYYHNFIYNYSGAYGPGSPTRRFFPCLGNHDWGNINGNPTGANPYLAYFDLPGNERYYTFTQGECQFFVLDSDLNEPDGATPASVQGLWLQSQMAASLARFRIVVFHHAAYSSAEHGPTPYMQWPFAQWGADAVLTGHDHSYERLAVDGIPYFVNGLGGKSIYNWANIMPQSVFRYNLDYGAQNCWADNFRLQLDFVRRSGVTIESFKIASRYPSDVIPVSGITIGNIDALFKSDSLWFSTASKTGKAVFDIVIVPTSQSPSSLKLEWQSRKDPESAYDSVSSYVETVQVLNVVSNQWATLLTTKLNTSPISNSVQLPGNAQDYIDPGNGQVRVRMNYFDRTFSRIIRASVNYARLVVQ
jgi:hypothetical protein